jgi:hypothetical protein
VTCLIGTGRGWMDGNDGMIGGKLYICDSNLILKMWNIQRGPWLEI